MAKKRSRAKYQKELRKKGRKTRLRPWIFWVLFLFFGSILTFSLYQLYQWHLDNQEIKDITDKINKSIQPTKKDEEGDLVNPPDDKNSDYWYYIKMPFYEVDFQELLKKNNDTVAFIHMESSNINYPIVQAKDNEYYLTHAYDKSKNDAGWVFMDYRNHLNPFSDNVVIYGHGRLDKTVFGSLKNALTNSWQQKKDNYVIWLSTPEENMVFQIFSIYTIQSESYYINTDFSSREEKEKWIQTMKSRNTAPIHTEVSADDHVITLSTCQNNSGGRIVVHAKLIKRQKK